MTTWGALVLSALGVLFGGSALLWMARQIRAALKAAREELVPGRRWVVLGRLAAGLGSPAGRVAVEELVAAEARVREGASGVPAGAVAARDAARARVDELVGDALMDAARLGVSDRALARVLRVSVGAAGLLMSRARRVWGAAPGIGVWEELVRRRAKFAEADAAVAQLLSTGTRWLLNPVDGAALPADAISRIATTLGLPEALVESWALDETIVVDVPVAVGAEPDLRIDRFGDFDTRLGLVRGALDDLLAARAVAEAAVTEAFEAFDAATGGVASGGSPASGGSALDLAGRAPLPSLVSLGLRAAVWLAGLLRRVWAGVIRGPPVLGYAGWFAGRRGEGRRLRLTVGLHAPLRDRAVGAATDVLAGNRAARGQVLAAAGGLIAVLAAGPGAAGFDELAAHNVRTRDAVTDRDAALVTHAADLSPAVRRAARVGLPLRVIVKITGLTWEQVSEITRRFAPDPRERTRWVDPLTERWIGFWGLRHPVRTKQLTLANGDQVTVAQLKRIIEDIDRDRGGYQLAMLVDGRVAGMIGRERMALHDLSDGHFHHIGYDDPRNTRLEGFLNRLRDAGHQGVITFHPIPQRGMGLATLGGSFYYGIASVLTLGLLFKQQMLQMWGKFPDVRLLDAVRALPAEVQWRAVAGVVGARMDVPGALGYLRALALLNPDHAVLVGETTIAKEAVTDLLGDQAIHTINPNWAHLVQRLVAAIGLLRQALRDGDLAPARLRGLPVELADLITRDAHADPVGVAAGLVDLLVGNIGEIAELLGAANHPKASRELHSARWQIESGLLPMYNPYLRELLQAAAEVGYLVVLHNDFGLARVAANGRFADVTPDERFGAPLLALLAQYPNAKIILAHLGVGKFTTMSVQHLDLIGEVLSNPRFDHVSFDISWNEVTRHLLAVEPDGSTPILDRFIELVRQHPDRFVFGSDAVKPESNGQYFRQHNDLEPIFRRILDEVGRQAYENLRYRVLESRLADARRDVRQWVFNELSDPTSRAQWNQVLAAVRPHRRRITTEWFATEQRLGRLGVTAPGVGPDYELPDNTVLRDGSMTRVMHWRANRQVQSLIRWHNAVTPDVVSGRRLSVRLIISALRASWFDHQHARDDRREARAARKQAEQYELDAAVHTRELGLLDAEGDPYTVQALIAAGQTGRALTPVWARRVLELTQESELRRVDDSAARGRTVRRLLVHTGIAALAFAGVVAVGGWAMWPLLTTTTAGYVQFAIRGGLGLHRGGYSQQIRVLVESILERGQFNIHTIRRLIDTMRKYAIYDRATPRQIANFDRVANEFLVIAHVLERELQSANGETGRTRHDTALELFSIFLDKAGNALGAQAQSFHGLNPHGGLLGRMLNTTLALTFVVNAFGHINGAFTLAGFVVAVNAAYAIADLLFLGQAGLSAVTGLAGWDVGAHSLIRKLVHRLALPVITVANLLLTLQLGFIEDSAMVIPALTLTLSSGYLTILGLISEGKLGRLAPRRGAAANAVLNASLMAFGVITLLPEHWVQLLVGLLGAGIAIFAVSKIDLWLSLRTRAPPEDVRQLIELATRLARSRARLDATPQFRWDANRIHARNRLLPELGRVEVRVAALQRASETGPVPSHQLERAGRHVDTVVEEVNALVAAGGAGGPARLSHQGAPRDPRQAIARSPVSGTVSSEELVALGGRVGLPRREFAAVGMPELDAHDGLNHNVWADTGIDDLVLYSGADGRLHTDTRTLAVLRVLAVSHPDVVRQLLAHELAHLRDPHASEEQVQAIAPLPRTWPAALRTVVDAARVGVLAPLPGIDVRTASWHGPEGEVSDWQDPYPLQPPPAGLPDEVREWIGLWRNAAAELGEGRRDGPALTELLRRAGRTVGDVPLLVQHSLRNNLVSDRFRYFEPEGEYRLVVAADGPAELHVFGERARVATYALVAVAFAPWAGFTSRQIPGVARLAISGTEVDGRWLSSMEILHLRNVADTDVGRALLARLVADHPTVVDGIRRDFATGPGTDAELGRRWEAFEQALVLFADRYRDTITETGGAVPAGTAEPAADAVVEFHRRGDLDEERFRRYDLEPSEVELGAGQLRLSEIDLLTLVLSGLAPVPPRTWGIWPRRWLRGFDSIPVVVPQRELARRLRAAGVPDVADLLDRFVHLDVDGRVYTTDARVKEGLRHEDAGWLPGHWRERLARVGQNTEYGEYDWNRARERARFAAEERARLGWRRHSRLVEVLHVVRTLGWLVTVAPAGQVARAARWGAARIHALVRRNELRIIEQQHDLIHSARWDMIDVREHHDATRTAELLDSAQEKLDRVADPDGELGAAWAALLTEARELLAALRELHWFTAAAAAPTGSAEFWARAWSVLDRLAAGDAHRPSDPDRQVVDLLARAVRAPLAEDGDWSFLEHPLGRLAERLDWLGSGWSQVSRRQRLVVTILALISMRDSLPRVPLRLLAHLGEEDGARELLDAVSRGLTDARGRLRTSSHGDEVGTILAETDLALELLSGLPGWGLPSLAGHYPVDHLHRSRAELGRMHPIAVAMSAALRRDRSDPRYWREAWAALAELARIPAADRSAMDRAVITAFARAVAGPLPSNADWSALRELSWVGDVLATGTQDGAAPAWSTKFWSRAWRRDEAGREHPAAPRDLLITGLVAAAVGAPAAVWLAELPKRQQSYRHLEPMVRWLTDRAFDGLREQAGALLAAELVPTGRGDRGHYLGSWIRLVQALTAARPALAVPGAPRAAASTMLAELAGRLSELGPPERANELERATEGLRGRFTVELGRLIGAELDPELALPAEAEMLLWNVLIGYRDVARDDTVGLLARFMEVWQRSGDRDRAARAAWDWWYGELAERSGRAPEVALDTAPADLPMTLGRGGVKTDVLVGVAGDPLDILMLGYPRLGGSCMDCVHGGNRRYAQDVLLHPRAAVLYVWKRLPDGSRGQRLARLSVFVTDQGILPTSTIYSSTSLEFGGAFSDYLRRWAETTGQALLVPAPLRSTISLPFGASTRLMRLRLPDDNAAEQYYVDIFGGPHPIGLPHTAVAKIKRWKPRGWRRGPAGARAHSAASPRVGRDGRGGGVTIGPHEPARQAMLDHAETLYAAGRELDQERNPGQPRGPPVRIRLVPAHLRPAGAEGVIAFGWKHRDPAPDGLVLIFDDTFAEILEHIAAGRLTVDWWIALLQHERDFHLLGDDHTGHRHDRDADPIAEALPAARAAGLGRLSDAEADLVAEAVRGLWEKGLHGGHMVHAFGEMPFGLSVSPRYRQSLLLLPRHVLRAELVALTGDAREAAELTRRLVRITWEDRPGGQMIAMFDTTARELDRYGLLRAALDATDESGRGTTVLEFDEAGRLHTTFRSAEQPRYDELLRRLAAARSAQPDVAAAFHALAAAQDNAAAARTARAEAYLEAAREWLAPLGVAARSADAVELAVRVAGHPTLLRWMPAITAANQLGRSRRRWPTDLAALALLVDPEAVPAEDWHADVVDLRTGLARLFRDGGAAAADLHDAYQRLDEAMTTLWLAGLDDPAEVEETAITAIRSTFGREVAAARAAGVPAELLEMTMQLMQPWTRVLAGYAKVLQARAHLAVPGWPDELIKAYADLEAALRGALAEPGLFLALDAPRRLHAVVDAHVRAWAAGERLAAVLEQAGKRWMRQVDELRATSRTGPEPAARQLWRHDTAVVVLGLLENMLWDDVDVAALIAEVEQSRWEHHQDLLFTFHDGITPAEFAARLMELAVHDRQIEVLRLASRLLVDSMDSESAVDINLARVRRLLLDTVTEQHDLLTGGRAKPAEVLPMPGDEVRARLTGYVDAVEDARQADEAAVAAVGRVEATLRGPSGEGTGTAGGSGGSVAIGPQGPARRAMLGAAESLYDAAVPLDPERFPHLPRAPPGMRVLVVPAGLRPATADGVIAFGWHERGAVLVFDDVLVEIHTHIASRRLPAAWWNRLLAHERDFHLGSERHTGLWHDLHAAGVAARLVLARVMRAAASAALPGVSAWLRARQGQLLGLHVGVGMTVAMAATYATFDIAATYGVPTTSTLLLAFAGWGVGGLSLLVNALFGKRLGVNAALGIGLVASAALAGIALAPAAFGVLLVLYGLGGTMISASAIFQASLARHPLEAAAAGARQDRVQTWSSVGRAWLPLVVAGSVFALFGWRGAAVALGAMTAALTAATWAALRGGLAPPAAAGSVWGQARDSVAAAAKRAWQGPVRFVVSVPLLGFLIGFPIGWMLGAVSPMLKVHMPWLDAQFVVWAAAIVTFVHRYAAVWANGWWAEAKATRPWMGTLVGASLPMVTVPLLVGALLAWPHLATSAVPLVGVFVAVSIAFQLPMGPTMALTRGVAGTSRFLVGTQLGAAAGVGLTQLVVAGLAPGGLTVATAGAVELTLGTGYVVITGVMLVVARLVTRFKVGSIARLEAAIAGLVAGPAAGATAAAIMTALEGRGILNVGDLIGHTPAELRALGLTGEQVVLVERGLAELGHTLRGPPPAGPAAPSGPPGRSGPSGSSPAGEPFAAEQWTDGAAMWHGFLPGEESPLKTGLREAMRLGVAEPVDPAELPESPRGPPPARVVRVPGTFLRERGLGRVVDHLGAYTLHEPRGAVIAFTDEMFARLRDAGLLGEILRIEVEDRVLGRPGGAAHQRRVDAAMDRLPPAGGASAAPAPVGTATPSRRGLSAYGLVTGIGVYSRRLGRGITIRELAEATGLSKPHLQVQVDRLVEWGVVEHDGLRPRRHVLHPGFALLVSHVDDLDAVLATAAPDYADALAVFADRLVTATNLDSGRRALEVKESIDLLRGVPESPIHGLNHADGVDHSTDTWLHLLIELAGDPRPNLSRLTRTQLRRAHPVDYDTLAMGLAVVRQLGLTEPGADGRQPIGPLRSEAVALLGNPVLRRVLQAAPLRLDQPIAPIVAAFRRLGVVPVPSYSVRDLLSLFHDGPRSVAELRTGFPGPEPTLRHWLDQLVDWGVLVVVNRTKPMRYALTGQAVTWLRDARAVRQVVDRGRASDLVAFTNLLDTLSPRDQSEVRVLARVIDRLQRPDAPITSHALLSLLAGRGTTLGRLAATGLDTARLAARLDQLRSLGLVAEETSDRGPSSTYRLSPLGAALLPAIDNPTEARLSVADATEIEIAEYRGLLIHLGLMLKTTTDLAGTEIHTPVRFLLTRLQAVRGSRLAAVAPSGRTRSARALGAAGGTGVLFLVVGAVLWGFVGGDAAGVAMAAALPFGRPGGLGVAGLVVLLKRWPRAGARGHRIPRESGDQADRLDPPRSDLRPRPASRSRGGLDRADEGFPDGER